MTEQVVGTAAGGVVTVTLSSSADTPVGLACDRVHIDPAAIDPEDPSLLEDLVLAAINDALSNIATEPGHEGVGGLAGILGGLGDGLSGLGADLPGLLAGGLSGLGASLPDLLSGAMEALGLSGAGLFGSGATEPPATEPPATEPPGTEPPGTEPAGTEPPATEPAGTEPAAGGGEPPDPADPAV